MTPKQERFVEEYLIDMNATQAAIRAGYSKKTAGVIGDENLKKPKIATAIAETRAEISKKLNITVADVIAGLRKEANYRGPGCSHSARVNALTQLGRHLGMFDQKSESAEDELSSALTVNIIAPDNKADETSASPSAGL